MKGMNPGPTVFLQNPQLIYAVFLIFILANLLMLPLGWAAIKSSKQILRVPRNVLIPVILLFCIVGSYAMTNSVYGVIMMLVMGVLGWVMEENGFPIAPAILGLVLGEMLEQNFMTSMIKSDGAFLAFFERPIAGVLGVATLLDLGDHALARHQPLDGPGRAARTARVNLRGYRFLRLAVLSRRYWRNATARVATHAMAARCVAPRRWASPQEGS